MKSFLLFALLINVLGINGFKIENETRTFTNSVVNIQNGK